MEKERKITAPDGCEIEKVELVDGVAVVTFREKERKLPKSWEEFCEMFPDYSGEYFIYPNDEKRICQVVEMASEKRTNQNSELLPDRDTAEAVLALCQLIQLRDRYNGDWVPNWDGSKKIYFIIFDSSQNIRGEFYSETPRSFLYFKTKELRDEFLRYFRPLIEKLKPLYGVKKGGQK